MNEATFLHVELPRAHAQFLPLLPRRQPGSLAPEPPQQIVLQASAATVFRGALEVPRLQGGVLFGHRRGQKLDLHHVHRGGYHDQDDIFAVDPAYLLGLTDAYRQADPGLDWVAQWLILPGGHWDTMTRVQWVAAARARQTISALCPLVFISWVEGVLTAEAVLVEDDAYVVLPISIHMV